MTKKTRARPDIEVSAGGIVLRDGELLLVQVKNLEGRVVWTFPKGHLEAGETLAQAAVREVEEETGWACRPSETFLKVRYFFRRNGRLVRKTVHWFLMEPLAQTGEADPDEILECAWVPFREAADRVVYDSDKKILAALEKAGKIGTGPVTPARSTRRPQ
jgi:diadenosine hexaphosphate hydrolase (ATP-forming)